MDPNSNVNSPEVKKVGKLDVDVHNSFLKDEYLKVLDIYEDFDKRSLGIKGWSATIAIAAIGGGFQYKISNLWLFAAAASLMFWIIEAMWKLFQSRYAARIKEIEETFRNEASDVIFPLQIYTSWAKEKGDGNLKKKTHDYFKQFISPAVLMPHLILVLAGVILYICVPAPKENNTSEQIKAVVEQIKTILENPK